MSQQISRAQRELLDMACISLPQAYYLSLACHNAALLNVKLGRWADAQELVDEGIEFTKAIHRVAFCHV